MNTEQIREQLRSPEVSVVTQKASFTILAIKMHNASALYAET